MKTKHLKIVNKTEFQIMKGHGYGDSCYDLRSNENLIIQPGETKLIGTGIHFHIPSPHAITENNRTFQQQINPIWDTIGYEVQIRGRSGLSSKGILAAFGTVDSNYTGEVKVILTNMTKEPFTVERGDRIAQFKMVHYYITPLEFIEESDLPETDRGSNGFGSSGVN